MDLLECYRVYSTKGCLFQVVDKIKLVELEVMKIYEQVSCHANVNESESYLLESSEEKSSVIQDIVVGLDDDVLEIKTRFCSFSLKLEIVSLVGMGGIGKSTLARMVYDDPFIKYHFSIRAWVTVKDRQEKGLFLDLLDGILEFTDKIHEKHSEQLAEMLYRKLKHSRYLIVSDDVWSTEVWDKIRRCFPDDKNGSRILLTTRLTKVALHAKSDRAPCCLKFLDLEESWELLCHKVGGRKFYRPDLEDIGKKIAEQCQGLPLTILVVAGQLSKLQRTRMCWQIFAKTVGSVVTDEHEKCLDILALSYRNLPHHLKACFIYMYAFPAETAIRVQLLLVHLRYVTLAVHEPECPESISRLWNLQTFILATRESLNLPKTVWEMENLRHVCLGKGCFLPNPTSGFNGCKVLTNLQTITYMDPTSCTREVTENIPHLKKLAIRGRGEWDSSQLSSYDLDSLFYLKQLENLKLRYHNLLSMDFCPSNLKKLVLNRCSLSCGFTSSLLWILKKIPLAKVKERLPGFGQWPADTGTQSRSELELVVGGVKYLDRDDSYAVVWLREPTEAVAKASPCRQLSLLMDLNLGDSIRDQDEGWEMN
ncbi:putative late blight resistance protein R1B-16 [Capsicum chacoense]